MLRLVLSLVVLRMCNATQCKEGFCKGIQPTPSFGCLAPKDGKECYAVDRREYTDYDSAKACGKFHKKTHGSNVGLMWTRKSPREITELLQPFVDQYGYAATYLSIISWNLGKWVDGLGYVAHIDDSENICVLKDAPTEPPPKGQRCLVTTLAFKKIEGTLRASPTFNTSACHRKEGYYAFCQVQKVSSLELCKGGRLIERTTKVPLSLSPISKTSQKLGVVTVNPVPIKTLGTTSQTIASRVQETGSKVTQAYASLKKASTVPGSLTAIRLELKKTEHLKISLKLSRNRRRWKL